MAYYNRDGDDPKHKGTFDKDAFKRGIAYVESRNFKNPYEAIPIHKGELLSSAAGKYQFLYDKIKDLPQMRGVSKEDFLKNPELQEMIMDLAIEGKLPDRPGYYKNANDLTNSYAPLYGENWRYRPDEVAALTHYLGRKGARDYMRAQLEGREYTVSGKTNMDVEDYLRTYNEGAGVEYIPKTQSQTSQQPQDPYEGRVSLTSGAPYQQDPRVMRDMQSIDRMNPNNYRRNIKLPNNIGRGEFPTYIPPSGGMASIEEPIGNYSSDPRPQSQLTMPESQTTKPQAQLTGTEFIQQYIQTNQDKFANGGPILPKRRNGVRVNPDGSVSTHLMAYGSTDNGYVAHPTLFQNSDNSWVQFDDDKAFVEAKRRGEVYNFETEKEARNFSQGNWKKLYDIRNNPTDERVHSQVVRDVTNIGNRFENGGEINHDGCGGPGQPPCPPITVKDKNDPRYIAYRDSLNLYNYNQLQRKLEPSIDPDKTNEELKRLIIGIKKHKNSKEGVANQKILEKEAHRIVNESPNIKFGTSDEISNENIVERYRQEGGSWDIFSPNIEPKGVWWGYGMNNDYSNVKPNQKVIVGINPKVQSVNDLTIQNPNSLQPFSSEKLQEIKPKYWIINKQTRNAFGNYDSEKYKSYDPKHIEYLENKEKGDKLSQTRGIYNRTIIRPQYAYGGPIQNFYQDGGGIDPVIQAKKRKLRGERSQAYSIQDNTSRVVNRYDPNKMANDEWVANKKHNELIEKTGEILPHTPQSFKDKSREVILNPMTAITHLTKHGRIPDNMSKGERNPYDYAMDIVNPAWYAESAKDIVEGVDNKDITQVGYGAFGLLPFMRGKGIKKLDNVPKKTSSISIPLPKKAYNNMRGAIRSEIEFGNLKPSSIYHNVIRGDKLKGDVSTTALFRNKYHGLPEAQITKNINKDVDDIIKSIPPGGRFTEESLSADSFRLMSHKASANKNDFKIIPTGKYQPLNGVSNLKKELLKEYSPLENGMLDHLFDLSSTDIYNLINEGNSIVNEKIVEKLTRYTERLSKQIGKKIPPPKIIQGHVYIPQIVMERKGGKFADEIKRYNTFAKKLGTITGVSVGAGLSIDNTLGFIFDEYPSLIKKIGDTRTKEQKKEDFKKALGEK